MVPTVFILAAGIVQRSASQSTSLHSISLTIPGRGMVSASKRKARPTTSLNLALVQGARMSLKTRVTSRGSVTPERGVEMLAISCPFRLREWIVAVAFDIGIVADLLTDAAHAVAGFQLSLGFVSTHESEHVRTLDAYSIAFDRPARSATR